MACQRARSGRATRRRVGRGSRDRPRRCRSVVCCRGAEAAQPSRSRDRVDGARRHRRVRVRHRGSARGQDAIRRAHGPRPRRSRLPAIRGTALGRGDHEPRDGGRLLARVARAGFRPRAHRGNVDRVRLTRSVARGISSDRRTGSMLRGSPNDESTQDDRDRRTDRRCRVHRRLDGQGGAGAGSRATTRHCAGSRRRAGPGAQCIAERGGPTHRDSARRNHIVHHEIRRLRRKLVATLGRIGTPDLASSECDPRRDARLHRPCGACRGAISRRDRRDDAQDLDARVLSLRATRDRLRQLLERATSVSDIAAVEAQLSRVQQDLDSLEGRLKALRTDVALSAVTVDLDRRHVLGPLGLVAAGLAWVVEKLFVLR